MPEPLKATNPAAIVAAVVTPSYVDILKAVAAPATADDIVSRASDSN